MWKNKKYGMIALGCDKNRVDGERLLAIIREKGGFITDDITEAEVIIVNTCAFLNSAREEAIETVLECAAYREQGALEKLVVTGCLPEKFADEIFDELTEADVLMGINDYDGFFDALEIAYSGKRVNYTKTRTRVEQKNRVVSTPSHFAYLKVADGCNNHCTYCLIPKIRGRYRSEPIEKLVEEAKGLGEIAELILVAQDTTRYGEDLYGKKNLVELLQKLTELDNISSVRLLYCYPDAITDELIAEVKRNPKIVKYMDIPLQHSEDRVLKLMGRRGTRAEYLALIKKLRTEIPEMAIRSTMIAGFATETREELANAVAFLREARLTNCGFFAYSKEPDTPAYKLKGQIEKREKLRRVQTLYRAQESISAEFLRGLIGKTIPVLCDGINYERECFEGRAYFQAPEIDGKVYFTADEAVQGEVYNILIKESDSYDLVGEKESYDEFTQ